MKPRLQCPLCGRWRSIERTEERLDPTHIWVIETCTNPHCTWGVHYVSEDTAA